MQIEFDISQPELSTKTPFLYPGSKSRSKKYFMSLLPLNVKKIVSPFIGGGAIELYCASKGIEVNGFDIVEPLVNSWKYLQEDSEIFIDKALTLFPLSYEERLCFYKNQMKPNCKNLDERVLSDFERAVYFFLVSRQSFRGLNLSSPPPRDYRIGSANTELIKKFKTWNNSNLTVGLSDYRDVLDKYDGTFMFFDPPYNGTEYLYGTMESKNDVFDHNEFYERVSKLKNKWILTYQEDDLITHLYKDYKIKKYTLRHRIKSSGNKSASELFIMNF